MHEDISEIDERILRSWREAVEVLGGTLLVHRDDSRLLLTLGLPAGESPPS